MSDLIDRQQAIDVLEKQLDYLFMLNKKDNPTAESKWYGINWARNTIAELPTAEPKMGRWLDHSDEGYVQCPFCGSLTTCEDNIDELHYCFNCGAKMERSE